MNYSFKTISKKVMGDLHTPVSIYLKVRDIYPESALLESSDFHVVVVRETMQVPSGLALGLTTL